MRLLTGPTTPFGRLVEVAAIEAGVRLDVKVILVAGSEFLDALNPLRLIPTLVLADGSGLYDSRVIADHLAHLAPGAGLRPAGTGFDPVFETRRALICGIMDAGVARQGEVSRPEVFRSPETVARLEARIARGLARLEAEIEGYAAAWPRLDAIGTAVLLDYLDFRTGTGWRAAAPRLGAFHAEARERPAMAATRFPKAC